MAKKQRPYQVELKQAIYTEFNNGAQNVLAVMPTGSGKTVLFCGIAIEMAIDPNGPRFPTAILVHRKELVQQICLTLAEEGIPHNVIAQKNTIMGIIAAERQVHKRSFYDHNAPITVLSVDTFNSRVLKYEKWIRSVRFWITDEATHLLKGNKWGRAVEYFVNAKGLGVTATPRRLDKRGLGRHAFGVFDSMVQGPTVKWLIRNNYLSRYKIAVPPSDYRQHLKKASDGSDYSAAAMAEAVSKSHIVGDAVENYVKFAPGKQAIYFVDSIDSGSKIESNFNKAGIKAKLLTGDTPDSERLESLIAFKDKRIQVLLNVDLFDEGLDCPGIEVVGFCRPTASVSKFLQMCGRGLRILPGKEFCIFIDHVGNFEEHGFPDDLREWTLDNITKRQDKTNLIRICHNPMCNAPYDRYLTECPYCGQEALKASRAGGAGRPGLEQVDGDLYLMDPDDLREIEKGIHLEDPGSYASRVAAGAGNANAGKAAVKYQKERIATQKDLIDLIAKWAGLQRDMGKTDRQIHKKFYLENDMTINQAISEKTEEMKQTYEFVQSMYEREFKWLRGSGV